MTRFPLQYLTGSGARADTVVPLTWWLLIVSVLVTVVIGALLWIAIAKRRAPSGMAPASITVTRGGNGIRLIAIGVAVSMVLLLVSLAWTMVALARIGPPPRRQGVDIEVTGHQWWWQVDYNSAAPADRFTTANEIHIPVGVPVRVRLRSSDVIHSFWPPQLTGKTDAIPGQTNLTWLQADEPGRYRGQCQEFCGFQHAHMAFEVVAESPAQFAAWRRAQLQTAPPPLTAQQARGLALVEYRCALCHTVRGTHAGSNAGPDLTHLMSRRLLAAGTLLNQRGNLAGWISDPQAAKPGTLMPNQHLSGRELADLTAYLETLQ